MALDIRADRRDLYRPAVLRWMMPLVAILSTIDTVWLSAALAPYRSSSSREARMAFSDVRSFERICRLCSRRLTFCRFALRADFVRLATVLASSLSREKPGSTKERLYHYAAHCGWRMSMAIFHWPFRSRTQTRT